MAEKIEELSLADIQMDEANANKGTERGRSAIEASLREFGFADAGTLDKNNRLIGGNKRTEVAADLDMNDVLVIEVDGTKPVYIKRTDLDLESIEDDRARRLAYALNRTQELSLAWDPRQVMADLSVGVDLDAFFNTGEMEAFASFAVVEDAVERMTNLVSQKEVAAGQEDLKIAGDTPYVQIALSCDQKQREFIMAAVRRAKEQFSVMTTTQAILKICEGYLSDGKPNA